MCYDPDVSKIVTEHHLDKADNLRKRGEKQKAKQYLQKQGITESEQISYKYAHLKTLLDGGKQPA